MMSSVRARFTAALLLSAFAMNAKAVAISAHSKMQFPEASTASAAQKPTVSSATYSSALNPLLQHDPKAEPQPAAAVEVSNAVPTATTATESVRAQALEPAEPSTNPSSEPNNLDSNWAISPDYNNGMPI